jgi:hypothetical protein
VRFGLHSSITACDILDCAEVKTILVDVCIGSLIDGHYRAEPRNGKVACLLFFQVVTDYPKTFEVFPDYQRHSHCQYFGTANSICKGET